MGFQKLNAVQLPFVIGRAENPLDNLTEIYRGDTGSVQVNQRGQLIEIIFADDTPADLSDNSRTINLYDRGGRLRASIDQAGHVTHYVYDMVDRLIETIHPDEGDYTVTYTFVPMCQRKIA